MVSVGHLDVTWPVEAAPQIDSDVGEVSASDEAEKDTSVGDGEENKRSSGAGDGDSDSSTSTSSRNTDTPKDTPVVQAGRKTHRLADAWGRPTEVLSGLTRGDNNGTAAMAATTDVFDEEVTARWAEEHNGRRSMMSKLHGGLQRSSQDCLKSERRRATINRLW